MPAPKKEYCVCPACDCIITPQQIQNGKSKLFCGTLRVHTNCPSKVLATIREETKRVFLGLAEKIDSTKDWARQVLEEIAEITEDALWRIEAVINRALGQLKELLATASLFRDKNSNLIRLAEKKLMAIHNRFFWKQYPLRLPS